MSHRRVRRSVGTLAALVALCLGPAQLASADDGGGDTSGRAPARAQGRTAVFDDQRVVELTEGRRDAASGLFLHQTHADTVTATNAAVAYTSCDGCRAVSLSFQVVVADGGPTTLDVGNAAVAMTEGCTGCESVAVAYQLVLASDRRLRLTGDGHQAIADLRRDLRRLSRSDLEPWEIQQQAEALMGEVSAVLADELEVRARVRCDHEVRERPAKHDRADDAGKDRAGKDRAGQDRAGQGRGGTQRG
jgi:hypothetical protein